MSEELKLCPFCGKAHPTRVGRGIVYRNDDLATKEVAENYQHAITFLDGGLPCPFSLLVVTAEQWNTRPLEDAQTAEIARLQSELQQARDLLDICTDELYNSGMSPNLLARVLAYLNPTGGEADNPPKQEE